MGFVIDNAIDVPQRFVASGRVIVVPGTVRVRDQDLSLLEYEELLKVLRETDAVPSVGIPPPARFIEAYKRALSKYDEVISIHTTSTLTTMINSARMAAKLSGLGSRIHVIDSGSATVAAGLAVTEGIEADDQGFTTEQIKKTILNATKRVGLVFYLMNIPALHRIRPVEGIKRILSGQTSLSSAIKLIGFRDRGAVLTLMNAKIRVLTRPSNLDDAVGDILAYLETHTDFKIKALVGHSMMPEYAEELATELSKKIGYMPEIVRMSPLILAAVGPDLFGVGFMRLENEN